MRVRRKGLELERESRLHKATILEVIIHSLRRFKNPAKTQGS